MYKRLFDQTKCIINYLSTKYVPTYALKQRLFTSLNYFISMQYFQMSFATKFTTYHKQN